ncbi:hypothetical protein NUU61_008236 [Penicillium alfredii]|uniref:Tetrapyrrole biosynthesis uroporphyrinogen III synthase domain-containing protein n=1 Tax=Penicillium alfredii TaxID=1506179 RepID=A0A9W9ES87_9EURO|nr:uncharacterized protein NUU61_008236 [Penicillium alfredii]KAJ5086929.1 hypothetical protein NUU61_008236 [Penicillium alfredii]
MSTPILLLKTKSTSHDGYDDFFSARNYTPSFIPVLEHRFHTVNLARVRGLFASGAFGKSSDQDQTDGNPNGSSNGTANVRSYGGLIFTSQRAVEGLAQMLEAEGLPPRTRSLPLILYTVGPATARALGTVRDAHFPHASIHGADAGNGENLAHMILDHYNARFGTSAAGPDNANTNTSSSSSSKPALLFLVGEQRRDIIPKTLMAPSLSTQERVDVEELVVYETGVVESFERDFQIAVSAAKDSAAPIVWVVVFSPTGCDAMLKVLELGSFGNANAGAGTGTGAGKRRVFVATIGPTTRDHLRNKYGFEADVCAQAPSPEGVGEGIEAFVKGLETDY